MPYKTPTGNRHGYQRSCWFLLALSEGETAVVEITYRAHHQTNLTKRLARMIVVIGVTVHASLLPRAAEMRTLMHDIFNYLKTCIQQMNLHLTNSVRKN